MIVLASQPSIGLVVGLGLGMVFFGLICIIMLCYLLGAIIRFFEARRPMPLQTDVKKSPSASTTSTQQLSKNPALIAAISAAIAENLGKDVSAIRIKSIKKL